MTEAPPTAFSPSDLLACARRELGFRQRVFPRQVENGRMTAAAAAREIAMMAEIARRLEKETQGELFSAGIAP